MKLLRFKIGLIFAIVAMAIVAPSTTFGPAQKKKAKPAKPSAPVHEPIPENYFPLSTGNFWLYRAKIEIGNDKGGTDKIDKPRRIQVMSGSGDEKSRIVQLKNDDYNGSTLFTYSIRGGRVYQFDDLD